MVNLEIVVGDLLDENSTRHVLVGTVCVGTDRSDPEFTGLTTLLDFGSELGERDSQIGRERTRPSESSYITYKVL